jgi:hypothetical protein
MPAGGGMHYQCVHQVVLQTTPAMADLDAGAAAY